MLGERTGVERLTDESSEDSQNTRCWRYDRIDTFGRFWCEWYSSGGINNKFNRSNGTHAARTYTNRHRGCVVLAN